jgi:hypothetical protein
MTVWTRCGLSCRLSPALGMHLVDREMRRLQRRVGVLECSAGTLILRLLLGQVK